MSRSSSSTFTEYSWDVEPQSEALPWEEDAEDLVGEHSHISHISRTGPKQTQKTPTNLLSVTGQQYHIRYQGRARADLNAQG